MQAMYPMELNPLPQLFLEAVQARCKLALVTKDPDPRFREILVNPWWLTTAECYYTPRYVSFDRPEPSLWCEVPYPNGDGYLTNHDAVLRDIVEWGIVDGEELTSRRIPQKSYYDFEGHPLRDLLVQSDLRLRRAWAEAASKPVFDSTPFIEKDRQLGEIAEMVRQWVKGL